MKERMLALALILAILSLWGCGAGQQPVPEPSLPPPSLVEPNGQVLVVTASLLNLRICPAWGVRLSRGFPGGRK
jgi:ABC-type nitrate/sulfonate/bicarbonate transport system permease component